MTIAGGTRGTPAASTAPAALYRAMCRIRRFEELVIQLVNANEIAGVTHEYIGQEAVAVGVCAALRPDDLVTSTHRGHGHVLAKGADPGRMLAELMGRVTGLNRGRGGSMHVADVSLGVLGANGMVGAGAPIAAGAAWAALQDGTGQVAVSFFGDGALNQGVLLEAMNLAALWRLPTVFVCENNGYAVTLPVAAAVAGTVTSRAAAFGIPTRTVDGMDVEAVHAAAAAAVAEARAGGGPWFLECRTYRFEGHHTAERLMRLGYRTDEEVASWRARDPLLVQGARLAAGEAGRLDAEVAAELEAVLAFARSSPPPDPADAGQFMYASGLRPRMGVA